MTANKTITAGFKDWWFARVHRNSLIYNTCWEDPVADKAGLHINEDSDILMITSAGCNALSYLLDNPASIDCVDLNPRQNALLELKKALFIAGDHQKLFDTFGKGVAPEIRKFYKERLRNNITDQSKKFWDKHLYYFSGKGIRKTFYQHGTAGILSFLAGKYISLQPGLKKDLFKLFESKDLYEQCKIYSKVEPVLLKRWLKPILESHFTMSLAGIPLDQQDLAIDPEKDGLYGYIKRSLRSVFCHLPARENYFWRLYLDGRYRPDCCPEYLEKSNFEKIRDRVDRISIFTNSIEEKLKSSNKKYSHFILLDHQDWLAKRNMQGLKDEWDGIFKKAKPGAVVLMRSAADNPDFLPESVTSKLQRHEHLEKKVRSLDRVGTYTSTWIMTIK